MVSYRARREDRNGKFFIFYHGVWSVVQAVQKRAAGGGGVRASGTFMGPPEKLSTEMFFRDGSYEKVA